MHAITHTNEPRANERALVVSDSSVYSVSYQKITTAKHKAREKGRKRENFSGERKRVCGREQKARIVREPNTEISFFFPRSYLQKYI